MLKVNVKLPVDSQLDPERLAKAIHWAMHEPESLAKVWRLNDVPSVAQIEEWVFLEGEGGLVELYDQMVKGLRLPQYGEAVAVLEKALKKHEVPAGQLGLSFDEDSHPRQAAGTQDPKYKPGEFVPKEHEAPPAEEEPLSRVQSEINRVVAGVKETLDRDRQERLVFLRMLIAGEIPVSEREFRVLSGAGILEGNGLNWTADLMSFKFGEDVSAEDKERLSAVRKELSSQVNSDVREWRAIGESANNGTALRESLARAEEGWAHPATVRVVAMKAALTRRTVENAITHSGRAFQAGKSDEAFALLKAAAEELSSTVQVWSEPAHRAFSHAGTPDERAAAAEAFEQFTNATSSTAVLLREAFKNFDGGRQDYFSKFPLTSDGIDGHFQAHRTTAESVKAYVDIGNRYDNVSAKRLGLPEGTVHMTHAQHRKCSADHTSLGDNYVYVGPVEGPSGKRAHKEALAMKERVEDRVPAWIRKVLSDQGFRSVFSYGPPKRVHFPDQGTYFEWMRNAKGHYAASGDKLGWDTVNGFYDGTPRGKGPHVAITRVGSAPTHKGGKSSSLCTEVHEVAHAIDHLLREDGVELSKTAEFQAIWKDVRADCKWYYKEHPWELFAEGLACFTESEEARNQMAEGPEPYRRLHNYFTRLLEEPTTETLMGDHPVIAKSMAKSAEGGEEQFISGVVPRSPELRGKREVPVKLEDGEGGFTYAHFWVDGAEDDPARRVIPYIPTVADVLSTLQEEN